MENTDVGGVLFALVGVSWLVRFAIDPAMTAYALVSVLLGVGFLALGVVTVRRGRQSDTAATGFPVVPVLAVGALLLGVIVYVAV